MLVEPYFSNIYINNEHQKKLYVTSESAITSFDLEERIVVISDNDKKTIPNNDIIVEVDAFDMMHQEHGPVLQDLNYILSQNEFDIGEFELSRGVFSVKVNKIKTYEKDLIICKENLKND